MNTREATLGKYVELQRGQSYKSEFIGLPGPVLLGLGTIERNGGFRGDSLRTYGGPTPERIKLRPGDIYVSLKDVTHAADLLGAAARVPAGIVESRLTQDTVRVIIIDDQLTPDYLYWALRDPAYRSYCRALGTGTTNLDLSREDFLRYSFWLPSIPEQEAIATLLGALDDKIATNALIVESAEALAVALIPGQGMGIALAALVRHRKETLTPASLQPTPVDHFSLPAFDASHAPDRCAPAGIQSNKYRVPAPAVLVSKLNPRFPRVWEALPDPAVTAVASTEFLVLEPQVCSTAVLWATLARPEFWTELEGKVAGTSGSHQRVRPADLLATNVPDPRSFGDVTLRQVETLVESARAARAESRTVVALRDALLPQLMSGRMRVRDADKLVSNAL